MLVLSRKVGEAIQIAGGAAAGGVTVTVVAIHGREVRIGVEAPAAISVNRSEVQRAIDQRAAAEAS